MLPLEHPDRIHVAFDDHRLVAKAGLLLPTSLTSAWVWVNWRINVLACEIRWVGPTSATS